MSAVHLQEQKEKLVAGHVTDKNGYLYCVLNLTENGKRKPKWIPTGLKVKGNKTRANDMLLDFRREWTEKLIAERESAEKDTSEISEDGNLLFVDLLYQWLAYKKKTAMEQTLEQRPIDIVTYAGYATNVKNPIAPYFREHPITVQEIKKDDIKAFYEKQLERIKVSTVKHYHAVIHGALNFAVDKGLIQANPSSNMGLPQLDKFKGDYYSVNEVLELFRNIQGTTIEFPTMMAAVYGLRRSEILGLKWNAFDFTNDAFIIRHTVTSCNLDGKHIIVAKDKTKTKSSRRTMPLIPFVKERLLAIKAEQEENRKLCGRSYCKDYLEYVCVDALGERTKPNYVSSTFPSILKKTGMRHIRFHDLRHTCAALLMANGVPVEKIMEWLGHSEISTTVDIYGHLEFSSKMESADTIVQSLQLFPL